jgi:hypothetical protein
MAGARLVLLVLGGTCACATACGGKEATVGDDTPGAGDVSGALPPSPLCGVSNVVTGQKIWGLQLAVASGQAFYTTYGEGADLHHHGLWSVPTAGGTPSLLWRGPSGILGSGLMLVDQRAYLSGQLTWGAGDEGVFWAPLAGGDASVDAHFATPCAAYGGMALDESNLYAAQSGCAAGTGQILALPRAGGAATSLWSGDHPGDGADSVAVHGADLYFLRDDDDDGDGAVMRLSTTAGSSAVEIDAIDEAHGLAVDDDGVYVTRKDTLLLVPADGSAVRTLASNLQHPSLVAVDASGVYVALGNLDDGSTGGVVRVPHGGGAPTVMATGQPAIFALALDDVAVYWASQTGGLVARAGKCL